MSWRALIRVALMSQDQVRKHIDEGEEEQPDHIDEVPIPSCKLTAEMLLGGHVNGVHPDQTDQ